jgi:hypothetical protein
MGKLRTTLFEALICKRPERDVLRRPDFKGERGRCSIRLPRKALFDLEVIKLATGEDKNAFIARQLDKAIEASLKELRAKHGDEAWEFIVARAAARTR